MKKKKIMAGVVLALLIICAAFSDPVRAIRISAVLHGCDRAEVMNAEIEKVDTISLFTSVYRATNAILPDRLTGSGHQTWYVYKILFVNVPKCAGNG